MVSLIFPSRGRAKQAKATAEKFWKESMGWFEIIVSIDNDDPQFDLYDIGFDKGKYNLIANNNTSVVEATNRAAAVATGNILFYLSDDFECFPGWAAKIEEITKDYKDEWILKVNDGLQIFDNDLITIPIMSRALYQRLGYFWHPAYKSMLCDMDLYYVCKRMGVIKYHPEITFLHKHPCNGTAPNDPTYIRSHENYAQGREVFADRKRKHFR